MTLAYSDSFGCSLGCHCQRADLVFTENYQEKKSLKHVYKYAINVVAAYLNCLRTLIVLHHHYRVEPVIIAHGHWKQLPGVIAVMVP